MNSQLLVTVCLAVSAWTCTSASPQSLCKAGKGWELVFGDEFDGNEMNASIWTARTTEEVGHENELQYYSPYNAEVHDGYLVIETRLETYRERNYTSAWVDTNGKFSALYGRVCVGAILPRGKLGIWPAHWMLPQNSLCYEGRSEIDIMEMINGDGQVHGSLHFNISSDPLSPADGCSSMMITCTGTIVDTDYTKQHEYAVEWSAESLTFFLDAEPYVTCYPTKSKQAFVPTHPMFVILNTAVGGSWPKPPNKETKFPQHHLIDYVRITQHAALGGQVKWSNDKEQSSSRRIFGPRPSVKLANSKDYFQ